MSHATYAVVSMGASSGAGTAASAIFTAAATAGGVIVAGAAVYMVAQKMRSDYSAALTEYQTRSLREAALHAVQNAALVAAQNRAREMALSLTEKALDDPNTAFLLSGLGRLKTRLQGLSDPNDPTPTQGAALLLRDVGELLKQVASGEDAATFDAYEKLAQAVSRLATQAKESTLTSDTQRQRLIELVNEEVELLRADVDASVMAQKRYDQKRAALNERFGEVEQLAANQPKIALQSLALLRDRVRGELREAAQEAKRDAQNAARMRELVGEISASAQAVLRQDLLEAPRREAELLLRKVSSLVAATPVELADLEILATQAHTLLAETEKAIEEKAMAQYLEEQVSQVLGSLGYRVTLAASSGEGEAAEAQKMVAVLDSNVGVQLNIDGTGNLSGEMVAFSESAAEVDARSEERVCDVMDLIFDGLRRKNMVVREKKRHHFKPEGGKVKVVNAVKQDTGAASTTAQPKALEMNIGD